MSEYYPDGVPLTPEQIKADFESANPGKSCTVINTFKGETKMAEKAVSIIVFGQHDTINFGKHKGRKLSDVLRTSPGYLVWAYNNIDWFSMPDELYEDACTLSDSPYDSRQLKKESSSNEDAPLFDAPKDQQRLFDDPEEDDEDDDIPF